MAERTEPKRSRPLGYWDLEVPAPLPWRWATALLEGSRNYWIATTREDGRAHTRPVWGVWLDEELYFDTGSMSAGLTRDPRTTVHLESGDSVVILEGTTRAMNDDERARMVGPYNTKYSWDYIPERLPAPFVFTPWVGFGWMSDPSGSDRGALYGATGTRWHFKDRL